MYDPAKIDQHLANLSEDTRRINEKLAARRARRNPSDTSAGRNRLARRRKELKAERDAEKKAAAVVKRNETIRERYGDDFFKTRAKKAAKTRWDSN